MPNSFTAAKRHRTKNAAVRVVRYAKKCRNRALRHYVNIELHNNIDNIEVIQPPARFRNGYWAWIID